MGRIVFQELFQFAETESWVIGQERMKRELEKAVQGAASGIDGCYAGRCQYHVLLPWVATDIFQQSGLTRTGFACEENRVAGKLYEFQRVLEFRILKVYFEFFFQVFGAIVSRSRCVKNPPEGLCPMNLRMP